MASDSEELKKTAKVSGEFNIVKAYKLLTEGVELIKRSGVTFTPEQIAQIKALVEKDKLDDAQKTILDSVEDH